jgi:hypothetical protein
MSQLWGKYPAVIESYQASTRRARVSIKGITDGSDLLPEADVMYPVGDKYGHTDIRLLAGDKVWIEFTNGGDARYPLIVGYRNPESGNAVGCRKWHHDAMELTADGTLTINAAKLVINAPLEVAGLATMNAGASVSGALNNNGQSVGDTHIHKDSQGGLTTKPQ